MSLSVHRITWGVVCLVLAIGLVLFLGGLCSAALEIRREKRAGKTPTRPAWDERVKREAVPRSDRWWVLWMRCRYPGMKWCWCGRGTLQRLPSLEAAGKWEQACAAWEAGDTEAVLRHDAAGGYARVSVDSR